MDMWGVLVHKNDFPVISGVNVWLLSRFLSEDGIPSHKEIAANYSVKNIACKCNTQQTLGVKNLCGFYALVQLWTGRQVTA